MDGGGHIQEGFVNAEWLAVRGVGGKQLHHGLGAFAVKFKAGGNDQKLWAFPAG